MSNNLDNMEWEKWSEAFRLFRHGVTLRSCIPVAIVVGLILSGINLSDVILNGNTTTTTWLKMLMNFVVPFCVSSYGFLNARRLQPSIVKTNN